MPDLIEALLRNPIILVFLAAWVFSAVAAVRKKSAQQHQKKKADRAATLSGQQTSSMAQAMQREANRPMSTPSPTPTRPGSAEEIAEAIRRAMGLPASNRAPTRPSGPVAPTPVRRSRVEVGEPDVKRVDYDELPQRVPVSYDDRAPRKVVDYDTRDLRGGRKTLEQELNEKRVADDTTRRERDEARYRDVGADVRNRLLPVHIAPVVDRRAHRRRDLHRVLDLTRPATVVLAAEIFGKPLALRDEPGGLQPGS